MIVSRLANIGLALLLGAALALVSNFSFPSVTTYWIACAADTSQSCAYSKSRVNEKSFGLPFTSRQAKYCGPTEDCAAAVSYRNHLDKLILNVLAWSFVMYSAIWLAEKLSHAHPRH